MKKAKFLQKLEIYEKDKKVRNYIRNQEDHHKKKTFNQEHDEFIQKFEFQKSFDAPAEAGGN